MQTRVKQWIVDLETAALAYCAEHPDAPGSPGCPLHAESCCTHGPGCVAVVLGEVRHHCLWARSDPVQVARALLDTLSPGPAASPS